MNRLPEKLTKLRKHYNYSQSYLSGILGVDVLEYMGYENGRSVINLEQARKLASFYHIPLEELFVNDKDVSLISVANPNTDEINIEYFIPKKTFMQKMRSYISHHPAMVASVCGFIGLCLGVLIFTSASRNSSRPYVALTDDLGRLSVSDTTVVYIDSYGAVKGSGSNANGQISNLPSSSAIRVAEGSGFTVILNDDGTLSTIGLVSKTADIVESWKDIVDVAAGNGHVVACDSRGRVFTAGDNSYGQCDLDADGIVKVFASEKATFAISEDGHPFWAGEFIGSSLLNRHNDVRDIDVSENGLVILNGEGRAFLYTKGPDFMTINTWRDITDIACGNDFVAGLKSDGRVLIAIDNDVIEDEVSKWEGIIAIAAGNDYLIGFDGENIHGVGKNSYLQFASDIRTVVLPSVTGLRADLIGEEVVIQFEPVANATGYRVSFDAGTGLSYLLDDRTSIAVSALGLSDGHSYTITVTALGDGSEYKDSLPSSIDYYHRSAEEEEETVVIEIPLVGITKTEFESWLKDKGAAELVGVESAEKCLGSEACIISVAGIMENEHLTKSELAKRVITYTYCSLEADDE